VDVAHSVAICEQFLRAVVSTEHLDGETPIPERAAILARLAGGETKVVSNCMVLTEGWDCPPVGCAIRARPTKQMGLFRQMIGRVLRPTDDKPDAVILDHSGAVFRHGRQCWRLARSPRPRGDVIAGLAGNLFRCTMALCASQTPVELQAAHNGRLFLSQRDAQAEIGGTATVSAAGFASCSITASSS
jgi:superfamily II DNA or RNA helicase